jgi:hypothetical protein
MVKKVVTEAHGIAVTSPPYFCSIFISSVDIPNNIHLNFSDFLNVPSISDSDVKQAFRRLRSSKCINADEILNFIMKVPQCFNPLLNRHLNIGFLKGKYPTLWKQAAIMANFKKPNNALVSNYRPITILNKSSNFCNYNTLSSFLLC